MSFVSVYVFRRGQKQPWFEGTIENGTLIEINEGEILYNGFTSGRLGTWILQDSNLPYPEGWKARSCKIVGGQFQMNVRELLEKARDQLLFASQSASNSAAKAMYQVTVNEINALLATSPVQIL